MNVRLRHPGVRFAAESAGLALLYVATARLGYLAAIPPGNITLLWPPLGLALAAVLIRGPRAGLGIGLGSFAANAFFLTGIVAPGTVLPAAAGIALGSSLQALVAGALLRRLPGALAPFAGVAGMLRAAAAVAGTCLIAATAGVFCLAIAGQLPAGDRAHAWATWWLGDAAGIAVFTPLLLAAGGRLRRERSHGAETAGIVWGLGAALSLLAFVTIRNLETQRIAAELSADACIANAVIQETVDLGLHDLDAIAGFIAGSERVERSEFHEFYRRLSGGRLRMPGTQALEWIPRVTAAERADFESPANASGSPITERTPEGRRILAGVREEYFPVAYVEPQSGNEAALGFDLGSDPARLAALALARDTGECVATAPITLVQETGRQKGFLIFHPIYRQGEPPATVPERRVRLLGFALGVYRIGNLVEAALSREDVAGLAAGKEFFLFDQDGPAGEPPLYARAAAVASVRDLRQGLHDASRLEVGRRHWLLVVRPTAASATGRRTWAAWAALGVGLVFTGLLMLGFLQRQRIEASLRRSNQDLERLNAEIRSQQAQLLQSEKMASVGQLAAGVAHEINNPAGFVGGNLEVLQRYAEGLLRVLDAQDAALRAAGGGPDGARAAVERAKAEARLDAVRADIGDLIRESLEGMARIGRIVQDLRSFSHADAPDALAATDLNPLIDKVVAMAWNELKYRCEVVRDYGELPPITCNPGQISQVILNLVLNAAQAIPERGRIVLRTRAAGAAVVVQVEDTGCGIPPEHLPRIFDPFFTTKPVGKGTGLGLHICHTIVQTHSGSIAAASGAGRGTTITVTLPLQPAAAETFGRDAHGA